MKKKNFSIVILMLMGVLAFTGCSKKEGCTESWADNYDPTAEENDFSCYKIGCWDSKANNYEANVTDNCCCTYSVKYTLSCSSCDITYENSSGGTSQESNVNSTWSYSFTGYDGDFVYLSAQNNNNSGSITVNILVGGSVYKTSTSSGAYVIATASGSL